MTLVGLACVLSATAQVEPNVTPEAPKSGNKYVLVNKAMTANQYMSRTSWDGALYFLGKEESHYEDYQITAQEIFENVWQFSIAGKIELPTGEVDEAGNPIIDWVDTELYMGIPNVTTNNVNLNLENQVLWTLEPSAKYPGYYQFIAGEGNLNDKCIGLKMHLNGGSQYFIVNEPSNSWYPDFAGGTTEVYDESTGETTYVINDSTSFNWGLVSVEKLPEFMADIQATKAINDFHKTYVASGDYADFADGFKASYDAAAALYKSADYNWEEDPAIIEEMISKKVAFYNEIDAAQLIEGADAPLLTAIENAKNTFKTAVSASELDAAIEAIKAAVRAFKEQTGDLTALGTNMSFEDLSAQGGSETTSVADVPAGWNMYIGGKQVFTADDIRSNGITAWCGVNSDSEGTGKDGTEAFGIWSSGIPVFELSQKIEGLENGTYLVQAGLMAGANGNGSRMTTQRIFGNLNSTYYGDESMYDPTQLDQSEVYAFQGNQEITTDREMLPVYVRAYVWDGTLTFGVRTDGNILANWRTANNSAGGDGWFKTDNFTIQKLGYVGEDAAAVANHFIDVLNQYIEGGDVFELSLEEAIKAVIPEGGVTADTPADQINNVIVTLKDRISDVAASIAAYKKLSAAIENGYIEFDNYAYTPSAEPVLGKAIEDAEIALDEHTANAEQIDALIAAINDAISACKSEAIQVGEYCQIIQNGSFEDLSAQGNSNSGGPANPPVGWTLKINGVECKTSADYGAAGANMGWCAINAGDNIDEVDENGVNWTTQYTDGGHLWGIWAGTVPEVELSQSFSGLPKGTYVLSCDMVVQHDWSGPVLTVQRIFANNYITMYGAEDVYTAEGVTLPSDMVGANQLNEQFPETTVPFINYAGYPWDVSYGTSSCPKHLELRFGVGESGELKLGFRTDSNKLPSVSYTNDNGNGWFKLDNFQLFYESEEVPEGADATLTKKGDVNEDGKVDINDVVAIINVMAGTATWQNANVNEDPEGSVDINDVVAVINIMAGN